MAARLAAIRDGDQKTAAEDAVAKVDAFTVKLNLRKPDITLIPSFGDYPAFCTHPSFPDDGDPANTQIWTGAVDLVSIAIGGKAVHKHREHIVWWGSTALLDGIEFIDLGTDETDFASSFSAGEIDMNDETDTRFVSVFHGQGEVGETAVTASTSTCCPSCALPERSTEPSRAMKCRFNRRRLMSGRLDRPSCRFTAALRRENVGTSQHSDTDEGAPERSVRNTCRDRPELT